MFNFFTKSKPKPKPTITSSRTSSRVVTLQHEWTIDNMSILQMDEGKFLTSTKFSPPDHPNIEFQLKLYPGGDGRQRKDYMSLFLQSNIEQDIVLWFKLGIKTWPFNTYGTSKFGKNDKNAKRGEPSSQTWGWVDFFLKSLLSPLKIGNTILVHYDKPFIVQCRIRYVTDVKTCEI